MRALPTTGHNSKQTGQCAFNNSKWSLFTCDPGKLLLGSGSADASESNVTDDEFDVPSEVENAFEDMFEALQDKVGIPLFTLLVNFYLFLLQNTTVRWSAAKGLGRISERLSNAYSDQVLDNIMGIFTMSGYLDDNGIVQDLPPSAEHPWHGAILACAEMVRRGLVAPGRLGELLGWMSQVKCCDAASLK